MSVIRWLAHWDYVMRWSLLLHHPVIAVSTPAAVLVVAVAVWFFGGSR